MTDPIADMLTRIRNALIAKHKSVIVPSSSIKVEIVSVLRDEGYIMDYKLIEDGLKKMISIELKYTDDYISVIREIRRVSKPGRRIYVKKDEIPRVMGGLGISILSTSKGIVTGLKARSSGVGGEIICTVV
jgi:small subunit ribosomal protein S8